jgi:phage terminase large subunit-like protein
MRRHPRRAPATRFEALDLSTTTDVTALAWVFPPDHDDGLWRVLFRYFVRAENLRRRAERDRVPYDLWNREGFIEATPGNVVDYGAIEQRILADAALFQVREIAHDRGTAPTSRSASRTRAPRWSNFARAFAPWRRRPASSRS